MPAGGRLPPRCPDGRTIGKWHFSVRRRSHTGSRAGAPCDAGRVGRRLRRAAPLPSVVLSHSPVAKLPGSSGGSALLWMSHNTALGLGGRPRRRRSTWSGRRSRAATRRRRGRGVNSAQSAKRNSLPICGGGENSDFATQSGGRVTLALRIRTPTGGSPAVGFAREGVASAAQPRRRLSVSA
jgi:hypothetical protein